MVCIVTFLVTMPKPQTKQNKQTNPKKINLKKKGFIFSPSLRVSKSKAISHSVFVVRAQTDADVPFELSPFLSRVQLRPTRGASTLRVGSSFVS